MPTSESIARALGVVETTEAEARAVVEVAAMAVAIDHAIHRDEMNVLDQIARALGTNANAQLASLLRSLGSTATESAKPRLRDAAGKLESVASREVAYRAVCIVAGADETADDAESAFARELLQLLALSEEDAERLSSEVVQALAE